MTLVTQEQIDKCIISFLLCVIVYTLYIFENALIASNRN